MNFDDFLQHECPDLVSQKDEIHERECDAFKLISETLIELDLAGRPWGRFPETLTASDRQQLRDAESRIDVATLTNDYDAARWAVAEYKDLILRLRFRLSDMSSVQQEV